MAQLWKLGPLLYSHTERLFFFGWAREERADVWRGPGLVHVDARRETREPAVDFGRVAENTERRGGIRSRLHQ